MQRFLITVFIILALLLIWFRGVNDPYFLYLHDELLLLSKYEAFNSLWVRDPINFGSANSINIIVTFFDRLFYLFSYWLGFNLHLIQLLFYGLKLSLLLFLPYFGFKKIARLYDIEVNKWFLFVLSLWYAFNPFTVVYWHVIAFPLTVLLCYTLAPVALYYYHQSVFGDKRLSSKLLTICLFFLMSFGFYLSLVFFIFLFLYTLFFSIFSKKILLSLKETFILSLLYIPFLPVFFIIPMEMSGQSIAAANATGNEAFGNLLGGLLYPFLMWYSWAIYVTWVPRSIFTFSEYYRTIPVLLASILIVILVFSNFFVRKIRILPVIFSIILLIFFFFMKGGQAPLGGIYTFLISHVFIFNVFRSPDTKFSFGLILIISLMILLASPIWEKRKLIIIMLLITLIQGLTLFTGVAIKGENTENSSDRVIEIPDTHYEITSQFHENQSYGYVLPIPSEELSYFELAGMEKHLGQDLLPKVSQLPFVYISNTSGIGIDAKQNLQQALLDKNFTKLSDYPIKYILLRNDFISEELKDYEESIATQSSLIKKNNLFALYQLKNVPNILQTNNIQFKQVNPTYYIVDIKGIKKDQDIIFNQSFSSNWKIVLPSSYIEVCENSADTTECKSIKEFRISDSIQAFFSSNLFENSHQIYASYANKWTISPEQIESNIPTQSYRKNPDGSIDIRLAVVYIPQSVFYIGLLVSFTYFVIIISILLFLRHRIESKNV